MSDKADIDTRFPHNHLRVLGVERLVPFVPPRLRPAKLRPGAPYRVAEAQNVITADFAATEVSARTASRRAEPRALTLQEVRVVVERTDEDMAYEDHFEDPVTVAWVRDQLAAGNEWAWCHVAVRAEWNGLSGEAGLGGCSYESEADFRASDDYFSGLVAEALDDLNQNVRNLGAVLAPLYEPT